MIHISLSDAQGRKDLTEALNNLLKSQGCRGTFEAEQEIAPGEVFGLLKCGKLAARLRKEGFLEITHDSLTLTGEA